ncbi:MAG: glycogen synthase GlgA [Gallionella sp.]
MANLKILFATSEATPLIKTGGLADVSGALPAALRKIGVDVQILIPGYNQVVNQLGPYQVAATFAELPGYPASRLLTSEMPNGTPLLIVDCPTLYQREGGPYQNAAGTDWVDNPLRFGMLSKIAAVLGSSASPLNWRPDLVHCNDWQTGLAPAYLRYSPGAVPSIMAIHNMAFQGNFAAIMAQQLRLPSSSYGVDGVEFHGQLSFLKAGLFYANHITTVSPNYAIEIQTEELGFGMQGLLASRKDKLTGILNGIDIDEWDPASDCFIEAPYSTGKMAGKAANKRDLQTRFGLNISPDIPLLGVVSRFTAQKGLDILLEIAPLLTEIPVQLVMLGSGDAQMQKAARELAGNFPGHVGVYIGFSEELSHQIEAGADMFVMPSRFEPCGLNQFYSQRYGTPPIVHATGGLVDSVENCTASTLSNGTASGFVFGEMSTVSLYATIRRAVDLYYDQKNWQKLCANCMGKNFSWEPSAKAYEGVYKRVLGL